MLKTILQTVVFRNTARKDLYNIYMDSSKHSLITGTKAIISASEGGRYSAYDNYIKGKNLQLIKNKLIVQSWRASNWSKKEVDSTLILLFESKEKDTILYVTHANVPEKEFTNLKKGWNEYYWKPLQKFLSTH